MNLTELQIQLRSIEEHISDLQTEIEKMKPKPEDEQKAMFEKITKIAAKFPLVNRRLPKACNFNAKTYISCLAYIALADDSNVYDKLLFLCRLSNGMGLKIESEDIFKIALEINEKDFDKACLELNDMKYSFLADALILVNLTQEATEASLKMVADIANIFKCEKEDIRVAAMVSKALLTENFDMLKHMPMLNANNWMGRFYQHLPERWVKNQRVKCGEICTEKYLSKNKDREYKKIDPCVIKRRFKTGNFVKKGDELLFYEENIRKKKQNDDSIVNIYTRLMSAGLISLPSSSGTDYETVSEEKSINSPCDGMVFFIWNDRKGESVQHMDKYLEVYVVSYFDNYAEFYEWHERNERNSD